MGVCRLSFHVAMLVNGVTVGGRSHQAVALPLRCVCALIEVPLLCCVLVFWLIARDGGPSTTSVCRNVLLWEWKPLCCCLWHTRSGSHRAVACGTLGSGRHPREMIRWIRSLIFSLAKPGPLRSVSIGPCPVCRFNCFPILAGFVVSLVSRVTG